MPFKTRPIRITQPDYDALSVLAGKERPIWMAVEGILKAHLCSKCGVALVDHEWRDLPTGWVVKCPNI